MLTDIEIDDFEETAITAPQVNAIEKRISFQDPGENLQMLLLIGGIVKHGVFRQQLDNIFIHLANIDQLSGDTRSGCCRTSIRRSVSICS